MERPLLNNFSDPFHLNHLDNEFFIEHLERSDMWYLLGIRPSEDMEVTIYILSICSIRPRSHLIWNRKDELAGYVT